MASWVVTLQLNDFGLNDTLIVGKSKGSILCDLFMLFYKQFMH